MGNRLAQVKQNLKKNNRGSGMVLVLVTMLFVALLASTILYMTLIGYQMRAAEKKAEGEFYTAETAMDEVRAGVQDAVSESISAAYSTILMNYNNTTYLAGYADMTEAFQQEFVDELKQWKKTVTIGGHDYTVKLLTNATAYNTDIIQSYITNPNAVVSRTGNTWNYDDVEKKLRLRNIEITYTGRDGYITTLKTDLCIGMPDFTYINSSYSASGIQEFAIIAEDALAQQTTGNVTIDGSAYAGELLLGAGTSGAQLTLRNGSVVVKGNVDVNGATGGNSAVAQANPGSPSRLNIEDTASIWTERINVGERSSVNLKGNTYVADDLDLVGRYAVAWLNGNYYGFGSSATDSSKSSALLVDGRNTTLDLSRTSRLMLAGHSFINNSFTAGSTSTDGVLMGESLSVRQNQLAYLIPVEYFESISSNPVVNTTGVTLDPALNTAGQEAKALYKFEIKQVTVQIPGAGQDADYFFMTFPDPEDANRFFASYFSSNEEKMKDYLDNYTTLRINQHISSQTAGYIYNNDGSLGRYTTVTSMKNSAQQLQETYGQLTKTLFVSDPAAADDTTPYTYFVKDDAVKALPDNTILPFSNPSVSSEVLAVVVDNKGGTTVSTQQIRNIYPQASLIIASGNVDVTTNFEGLILSGGTVRLSANIFSDEEAVKSALSAVNGSDAIANYLKDGIAESGMSGAHSSTAGWNMSDLVTFDHWTKN